MKVANKTNRDLTFGVVTIAAGETGDVETITPAMRAMQEGGALDIKQASTSKSDDKK